MRRALAAIGVAFIVITVGFVALSLRPERAAASLVETRATSAANCPPRNAIADAPEVTVTIDANGKVADWAPVVAPYKEQLAMSIGASSRLLRNSGVYEQLTAALPAILVASGPYADEMRQVAHVLGIDLVDVVGFNVIYELAGGCTSIVANARVGTPTLLHGRNLDYDSFEGLEHAVVKVNFVDATDGAVAFSCATFAGYVGCLTGVRAGRFSVSLDQRYVQAGAALVLSKNFAAAFPTDGEQHGVAFAFYLRDMLHNGPSYTEAVTLVQTAPFVLGAYVTIGGIAPGEGAVVFATRRGEQSTEGHLYEISGTHAPSPPSESYPCTEQWCLVTNFDTLADAAAFSPAELYRIQGGRTNLQAAMPELTSSSLMSDVLTQCPSQTVDSTPTLYSAVMEARTGLLNVKKTILAAAPAA